MSFANHLVLAFSSFSLFTDWPMLLGLFAIAAIAGVATILHARDKADHPSDSFDISLVIFAISLTLVTTFVLLSPRHHRSNPTGDPSAIFYPEAPHPAPLPRLSTTI